MIFIYRKCPPPGLVWYFNYTEVTSLHCASVLNERLTDLDSVQLNK